jgi:hypothetical protein
MQSNGGLTDAHLFQGKDAILSGPAGGIVGMVRTAEAAGHDRLIGFDMGGTSTDVSHYAGTYERSFETEVAGVRMRAPMMDIHTVAAGGGSILAFRDGRFQVGPESAGADPGPGLLPARRAAHGDRLQRDAGQAPARRISPPSSARRGSSRSTRRRCAWVRAPGPEIAEKPARPRCRPKRWRGLPADRGRQHGQRDQEDQRRARL